MTVLNHVPATTSATDLAGHLRRDGYVIVDDLVPDSLMDTIGAELAPYLDATPMGYNAMIGRNTRRTGALIARSPACRTLVQDPTILGVCKDFLGHASAFQLMLTQVISIEPGESDQALHRDQNAFDFYPFPDDYHVQCNTLWAMTDYTAEMGATRVVPGSQVGDKKPTDYADVECVQAEMSRGSVLLYSGKIVHSGAANRSDRVRRAININYCVGWVRQEENQFLSVPHEVARTLDDDLLKLIGYQEGAWAMGYFRDFEDPLRAIRGDEVAYGFDAAKLNGDAGAAFADQITHSQ
ncbi:phytanoyl-CoA dioxygenase family protein [Mycolicibacterium fluoranthenivorans]|uniref:Ectoine hydroxylase-related dioxygenase (Phytanoyl-CoA dioxygenase family) n=1 Tax=Mycolicibacterium fluoranthenivorans TaxID=258505 RepID=A0A7X5TYQ6_9MYCO|nr:phytanoyl-CoA dioxygenase family protein [Mycolicibacterium fluoranthenivorans]MCV7357397.1 phytanoyl-CoA dioxygenase family protein [Mycolicibacterium fluoranthenivorans]NIH95220.1 ectoine hydroxylase-related dioxygenase (phytanoyl-CoA dioxygenase family) [Mycolicibacterium fluoranthenivorans]